MSLLTRAFQKIFGSTGGTGEFGQIGSKAAGAPVTTKNLETMQALSEYDLGLNAIVSDQGTSVLPYLEDINSLFFLTTSQIAYLMQSGVSEWDDATEYYLGISLVLYNGNIWVDTFGTSGTPNLNFVPNTNLDKWRSITTDAALVDSGAADAYVLTSLSGTVGSQYFDGMKVTFKAGNTNTGASTINVNSLGVKSIVKPGDVALVANEIISDEYIKLVYNKSLGKFELIERIFVGQQLQEVYQETLGMNQQTWTIPFDDTIPLISEGGAIFSLAITPKFIDSFLIFEAQIYAACDSAAQLTLALFDDSDTCIAAVAQRSDTATGVQTTTLRYRRQSNSISSQSFKIRIGSNVGTVTINGTAGARTHGGVAVNNFLIKETR